MVTGQEDRVLRVSQADRARLDPEPRVRGRRSAGELAGRRWDCRGPGRSPAWPRPGAHRMRVLLAWSLHSHRVSITALNGRRVLMSESPCSRWGGRTGSARGER